MKSVCLNSELLGLYLENADRKDLRKAGITFKHIGHETAGSSARFVQLFPRKGESVDAVEFVSRLKAALPYSAKRLTVSRFSLAIVQGNIVSAYAAGGNNKVAGYGSRLSDVNARNSCRRLSPHGQEGWGE